MAQHPVRICLIMHSTRSFNLGVGALTVAEVEILRDIAKRLGRPLDMTILDWRDAREPYLSGDDIRILPLDTRFLLNPAGFFRQMRKAHLVIDIGAGDSFTDIYGGKRLRWIFAMKLMALAARRPLVMAPQTVGPFSKAASTRLARFVMNRSALLATRDKLSTVCVEELGVKTPVIEASDVALRLPFQSAPKRTGGSPKVGINISGLLMSGGYTGKNELGIALDYPALIRQIVTHFQNHPEKCEVHLVSHVITDPEAKTGDTEDDYFAARRLADAFPGCVLAPAFDTPSDAKSYISGLDFFMGARMHACIAAFSSGVPVIPMAYSRKFEGLFGSIGYPHTVDCTKESADAVFAKIVQGFENRASLLEEQKAALALGREKLGRYEAALEALVSDCS